MSAVTASWQAAHGDGSIIALAPSSAASTILSDAIGAPSENMSKWIYESAGLGAEQRRDQIQRTEHAAALAHRTRRRLRQRRLIEQLAALRADHDPWTFHKNQFVIVDEASMAGTLELSTLARAANTAGAKLLLVGDDAQLSAGDTGGVFRLIAKDTKAAELTDVWRFTNPWERDASLALRAGDLTVIDAYDEHDRLAAGSWEEMEDAAYKAWLARALRKSGRHPAQIVGLVTPATHVSDPTLIASLRELESQMTERVNWLASELRTNPPAWYRELQRTASASLDQDLPEFAREIAAYRERYQVHGKSILGDAPPPNPDERRRQHSRIMTMLSGYPLEAAERSANDAGIAEMPTQIIPRPNWHRDVSWPARPDRPRAVGGDVRRLPT
ncbi:AAA family ATPase [Kribbella jiaozuonensis]|uniref:AAA family ATPase n=1 Tax=Kribbella jiaozuonensis TaxID=2575441 RepID=UPI001485BB14|nr:AAA family ATPase [Kribbella jiaozuonensis]